MGAKYAYDPANLAKKTTGGASMTVEYMVKDDTVDGQWFPTAYPRTTDAAMKKLSPNGVDKTA